MSYSILSDRDFGFLGMVKFRWLIRHEESLTAEQRQNLLTALRDGEFRSDFRDACNDLALTVGGPQDAGGLLDWISQHWMDILRILLAILPLFLGEVPNANT